MEDIRRQDVRLFIREATVFWRIAIYIGWLFTLYWQLSGGNSSSIAWLTLPTALVAVTLFGAHNASVRKRFRNKRMEALWQGCQDRLARFEEVLKKTRNDKIADLKEMPETIRGVSKSLYLALRRADIIADEVSSTESGMLAKPPVWQASTQDAQSQELYRIADKNIAEYRNHFATILAGVQRTEAQSAVFMTTLDSLRMKLLGYRLVGRNPEMNSHDFLEAIAEARTQLQAIDTALDELDLGHYPKTISIVPPAHPEEVLFLREKH